MSDIVDRTLRQWRTQPFQWGQRDCLLSIGDYIISCGGLDVPSRFRGTYDSEAGALAHIREYGGVSGLIDLTGLRRVDPSQACRGDVVTLDTGECEVGALCTGDGIAARLERGVIELNRRLVTVNHAWTFE